MFRSVGLFDWNRDTRLRASGLTYSQHVIACECAHELNQIIHFTITQVKRFHQLVQIRIGTAAAVVKLDHLDQCFQGSVVHVR